MSQQVQTGIPFKFVLFFLAFLLAWSQPSSALRCEQLFEKDTELLRISQTAQTSHQPNLRTAAEKIKHNLQNFMSRFKPQKISAAMVINLFDTVKTLLADTTGKRVENKVTAETVAVQAAMSRFKEILATKGIAVVDRDKKIPGNRNVTYTEYTQPFKATLRQLQAAGFEIRADYLHQLDKDVTIKIRIRSYGTVPESKTDFNISDVEFAEFTKDRAFVEFKFEDPSYDGAVFKPQAYMSKKYIQQFGKPEFLKNFNAIKTETLSHLQVNPKKTLDQPSVEAMLRFLQGAHLANLNLSIVAINLYERSAKSATLVYNYLKDPYYDPKYGSAETIALEMTFDQLIALKIPGNPDHLGEEKYYKAYTSTQTVSEFKTPTRIAHHLKRAIEEAKLLNREGLVVTPTHAKELEEVLPGLKEYFEMMDEIIQSRDNTKELNRGKWGIAIQKVKIEILNVLNKLYMDDLI